MRGMPCFYRHQTLSSLLQYCNSLKLLKKIHACLVITGLISEDLLVNKFLRSCARHGALNYGRQVFDQILQPNVFLWTSLIHGYVENRIYDEPLILYNFMREEGTEPVAFTLSSLLKALGKQSKLRDGEAIHGQVLKFGLGSDLILQNSILDMYSKCSRIDLSRQLFEEMPERDVISWNSMILAHEDNDELDYARKLFNEMPEKSVVSWTLIIRGFVKHGDMVTAQALFEKMPWKDLASWNVMISSYLDIGNIQAAHHLFEKMPKRDIRSWNLIIGGYCKRGEMDSALRLFNRMPERNIGSWTIMIDGYAKIGDVKSASSFFHGMPERNLISWSSMVLGYAKNGKPNCALKLFHQFRRTGIEPDETCILGVINACAQLGVINTAEAIVSEFIKNKPEPSLQLITSLIDLYSKCGNVERAFQIFEKTGKRDLVCYSAMITAFANHGMADDAIALFNEMVKANIKPDGTTFLSVLTACGHGGLVDEGKMYFRLMSKEFGDQPTYKHYACMVDLLGRAGHVDEAYKLIQSMPFDPHSVVWGALLAACRVHGNVKLAEVAAGHLFQIETNNSGNYILLSNIYAAADQWDDVSKVRAMIRERGVKKTRGSSWIELDYVVHEFVMEDRSHLDSDNIYTVLHLLLQDMKLSGYLIDMSFPFIDSEVRS